MENKDLRQEFLIRLDELEQSEAENNANIHYDLLNKLHSISSRANINNQKYPDEELIMMIEPCVNTWLETGCPIPKDTVLAERIASWRLTYLNRRYLESTGDMPTVASKECTWWLGKSTEEILDKLREQGAEGYPALARGLKSCGVTLPEIGRVLRKDGDFDSEDANRKRAQRLLKK